MYRTKIEELKQWKEKKERKPLILNGARQVGKTWLANEFGRLNFEEVAHVVFFNNQPMKEVFNGSLAPNRLLQAISAETDTHASSGKCLIILDEIQDCPRALESLKLFCEQTPEIPIIAAGSLLGISLHQDISFPVGKVEIQNLYPMNFYEFLLGTKKQQLADLLDNQDFNLINSFSEKFIDEYKNYLVVGGMPEAVKKFSEGGNFADIRNIQNMILAGYEADFSKHTPNLLAKKISYVWQSLPSQLSKENKRFLYSVVRDGARARGYEDAVQWLCDSGLVCKVSRISAPRLPLKSYVDLACFKLFALDVGILSALASLDPKLIISDSLFLTEFKGSITEQYVSQQLISELNITPYYWSASNSKGEVDFVIERDASIIPCEAKASVNLRAKSLHAFQKKYKIDHAIRFSLANYEEQSTLTNVPLYAIHCLKNSQPTF